MTTNAPRSDQKTPPAGKLGTFAGVFTPSILTILGIILFLRLGYVVGNAGLGRALIILVMANGISVLTSFSLSAIATNLRVRGGGDYYLISRTLGLQFGGSIGIVLYLAQSVSIAFYCIGFGEVIAEMSGSSWAFLPQVIAAAAVAFLFIFAWLGADWATRFQYVVMSILGAALISFFIGGINRWDGALMAANWSAPADGPAFWVIFAIFFPAVTGFTQGVSMSGDLKDPGRSLPLGTFTAVGISIVVYFLSAVVLGASLPQQVLVADYSAMNRVAVFGSLIAAGVIAATLSSAMASYLGAPRILQALAGDRIFPFLTPFAKGDGPANNPRRGVLLSTAIAFATIGLGRLNLIAPVVSMFFLVSYGLLNYATYFEARSASPSFRPRFRWYDARLSLVGFLACLLAMLAIDPVAGTVALAVLFAVYQYLKQKAAPARWADSRRSYHLQRIKEHLAAAAAEPEHPRYWRPQLLIFSDASDRRRILMHFAAWIQGRSGFAAAVKIITGRTAVLRKQKEAADTELKNDISDSGLEAFPLVLLASDRHDAVQVLVQAFGIGPVHANTILLNWAADGAESPEAYFETTHGRSLRAAFRFGCNLMMLDATASEWEGLSRIPAPKRRIDVWWREDATGRLELLLAYLITRSQDWQDAVIRLLAVRRESGDDELTVDGLKAMLDEARISAEPVLIDQPDADAVVAHSADAALVLLPFRLKNISILNPFGGPVGKMLERLPVTAMVLAAEDIDLDAEPEEGEAGEMAAALDALADAEKRVESTEKDVAKAAQEVEELNSKLAQLRASADAEAGREELSRLTAAIGEAEAMLKAVSRRLARERAKVAAANKEAEAVGAKKPDDPAVGE